MEKVCAATSETSISLSMVLDGEGGESSSRVRPIEISMEEEELTEFLEVVYLHAQNIA
jgi:hypothetical protein